MNPVRTFAPAFWSEKYPMHWVSYQAIESQCLFVFFFEIFFKLIFIPSYLFIDLLDRTVVGSIGHIIQL